MTGVNGFPRDRAHRGVDIEGRLGADVLVVADGYVGFHGHSREGGDVLVVSHPEHDLRSIYVHLAPMESPQPRRVFRGQVIGRIGNPPSAGGRPHVHLELCAWDLEQNCLRNDLGLEKRLDPLDFAVGCFDPDEDYPDDEFVLTYPVRC